MRTSYVDKEHRAIADLMEDTVDGGWLMTRINVPLQHRGKGVARRLMAQILADADRERQVIKLWVSASDGLTDKQLTAWYKRLGFKQEFVLMVRYPQ